MRLTFSFLLLFVVSYILAQEDSIKDEQKKIWYLKDSVWNQFDYHKRMNEGKKFDSITGGIIVYYDSAYDVDSSDFKLYKIEHKKETTLYYYFKNYSFGLVKLSDCPPIIKQRIKFLLDSTNQKLPFIYYPCEVNGWSNLVGYINTSYLRSTSLLSNCKISDTTLNSKSFFIKLNW
jgi:hypothetical protein